ncbi:hypothetical protein F2S72_09320 [Pseudomonas syringae pv. actinidiae]|nr:hypothetical protein [Pseudomonas syringae pv. actinidiae]
MTAPLLIPFWVPIVAPTLSNTHLSAALPGLTASKLATLRSRFGFPEFAGKHSINWLVLLGQIEDGIVADLVTTYHGVLITEALVATMRSDLGVSAYSARKPKLDKQVRDLVGRYTAGNIAKGWGVSVTVIEAYRKLTPELTMQSATDDSKSLARWKPEWIDLFAHQTNAQIARATGMGTREVRKMRNTLCIAPPSTRTYWKLVTDDELAERSDEQLSELHGGPLADYAAQRLEKALEDVHVALEVKRTKRLTGQLEHLLNQMPMKRLAKLSGVSEFHLKRQRDELGLVPYTPFPHRFEPLLSNCPDSEVAKRARTAVSTVKYRRERLGKPAFLSNKEK